MREHLMNGFRRRKAGKAASDPITAVEIACFAYCPEQWRLEYGVGLEPRIERHSMRASGITSKKPWRSG